MLSVEGLLEQEFLLLLFDEGLDRLHQAILLALPRSVIIVLHGRHLLLGAEGVAYQLLSRIEIAVLLLLLDDRPAVLALHLRVK
jgi:hypothetical protein